MIYRKGDYVYPADLPRPILCRVKRAEGLGVREGVAQLLELEPLEGPFPTGTELVRLDDHVLPAEPRQLWQGGIRPSTAARPRRPHGSHQDAA